MTWSSNIIEAWALDGVSMVSDVVLCNIYVYIYLFISSTHSPDSRKRKSYVLYLTKKEGEKEREREKAVRRIVTHMRYAEGM